MSSKIMTFALILGMVVAFIYSNAAKAQIITDGLVSYWSFDDGLLNDAVGGHDGTLVENAVVAPGKFGDALEFDGSGSYVDVADPDAFVCNADFTWSAWIKTAEGGVIIAKTPGEDVEGPKSFFVDETLVFDTGWVDGTGGEALVNNDEWHYVAMTVEIVDGDDPIRFYVDGEPDGEGAFNVDEFPEDGFPINIGHDPRGGLEEFPAFAGIIDEVSFYARVLSDDEIRQNFEAGALGPASAVDSAEKLASTWGEMKASR